MKKLKYVLSLCTIFAVLGMGCSTTPDAPKKDIAPLVKTAAYVGTHLALKERPEWRTGFEIAAVELATLAEAESIDFAVILSIVNRLPVKELQSDEAAIYITGATMLLSGYGDGLIPLDKVQQAKPIVIALRDGIALALR